MVKVKSISREINQHYWEGRIIERWFLLFETDFLYKSEQFLQRSLSGQLYDNKITKFVFHYFIWHSCIIQLCIKCVTLGWSIDLSELINRTLNSNAVVKEVKVIKMETSTTRKRRPCQILLQLKLKTDNDGFTSNCFPTTKLASKFLAGKKSKNHLNSTLMPSL